VQNATLKRELGLFDSTSILIGTIIGAAIFLIPSAVAAQVKSFSAVLLVWLIGGGLSIFGALSLGELGAAFPDAGGLYVYLSQAYGRPVGFLYGWGLFTVIHTGSIAAVAVAFSLYLGRLVPLSHTIQGFVPLTAILLLTIINCLGVRFGKTVQNIFTVAKLGGLLAMILLLFFRGPRLHLLSQTFWPEDPLRINWLAVGVALVAILWAYEGWHLLSFTAGEVKNPHKNLPQSYLYGTLVITLVYLLANASYYTVLTRSEIQGSTTVAASAMNKAIGPMAGSFISLLILISIFGALNGVILTGPRVYFAMARDAVFFRSFSKVNPRLGTPVFSLVAQGIWASAFTFLGTYEQLLTDVISTAWIFYGMTVAGVVVLRRKKPELSRPFRVPGYPWLPLAFCFAALALSASAVLARPFRSCAGMALILTGVPFYFWFRRRYNRLPGGERLPERDDAKPKVRAYLIE
jgi:APA family basic amino acid/polyamine antiporter